MIGLPDIGDPFDVAAFRAFRVPEDQDAFVLLRKAQAKLLGPIANLPVAVRKAGPDRWSKAPAELREWVTANRDVLEMFRDASQRPDGLLHPTFAPIDRHVYLYLGDFKSLALLEASRLEEQGDMAAAWIWYRAVLRMRVHIMRRGAVFQRLVAGWSCGGVHERIATWAADRRTEVPLLRQALDDLRACEPRPEWDAFSLKVDYLFLMSELDDEWGQVQHGDVADQHPTIAGEELPADLARRIYAVRRYYLTEPEQLAACFAWLSPTGWLSWKTNTVKTASRRCRRHSVPPTENRRRSSIGPATTRPPRAG